MLRQCGVRYSEILERCSPTGKRILGIGCAAGFILDGFRSKGWSCKGIEPNEAMGEYARGILGLDVETSSLELSQIQETFDVVEMIQVIAHITSPQKSFERVSQWLNPKGLLLVETWNYQSWTAKLCGQKWHEYSPPTVVQWFTPTTLSRLAADHGLELVASGRPSKWIEAGHAKSILHYKYSSKLARRLLSPLACIPNRLAVPYPADDLFWAIYRKRESSN